MPDGSLPVVARNQTLTGDVVLSSRDYLYHRSSTSAPMNWGEQGGGRS